MFRAPFGTLEGAKLRKPPQVVHPGHKAEQHPPPTTSRWRNFGASSMLEKANHTSQNRRKKNATRLFDYDHDCLYETLWVHFGTQVLNLRTCGAHFPSKRSVGWNNPDQNPTAVSMAWRCTRLCPGRFLASAGSPGWRRGPCASCHPAEKGSKHEHVKCQSKQNKKNESRINELSRWLDVLPGREFKVIDTKQHLHNFTLSFKVVALWEYPSSSLSDQSLPHITNPP